MTKKMLLIFLTLSTIASAYQINKKSREGNDEFIYHIKCDSGSLELVTENTSINQFFPGSVSSLDQAVKNVCSKRISKKNNKIKARVNALFFYKKNGEDGIQGALTSETSYYSVRALFRMTNKYGFIISKSATVSKLKYYPPIKVPTDKYGNLKKKGKYTRQLIDGFYKIKNNGNIYYVKESDIF